MLSDKVGQGQRLREMVENRIFRAGPHAELSIYDTYSPASQVSLSSGELLYCGMITGRKILHGGHDFETEFLPRESFVMTPGETIAIDFPDASRAAAHLLPDHRDLPPAYQPDL